MAFSPFWTKRPILRQAPNPAGLRRGPGNWLVIRRTLPKP